MSEKIKVGDTVKATCTGRVLSVGSHYVKVENNDGDHVFLETKDWEIEVDELAPLPVGTVVITLSHIYIKLPNAEGWSSTSRATGYRSNYNDEVVGGYARRESSVVILPHTSTPR